MPSLSAATRELGQNKVGHTSVRKGSEFLYKLWLWQHRHAEKVFFHNHCLLEVLSLREEKENILFSDNKWSAWLTPNWSMSLLPVLSFIRLTKIVVLITWLLFNWTIHLTQSPVLIYCICLPLAWLACRLPLVWWWVSMLMLVFSDKHWRSLFLWI